MKYGPNRINTRLFTQAGWLGGEKIEFHPWVQRSNFINDIRCGQHWNIDRNISYLLQLLNLNGCLSELK
jgi:hypothetical protein